jgi:integrase
MNDLALTPALDLSALERADIAPGTRRNYAAAIASLFASGISPFDYEALANYANTLPHSTRAALKASLGIMTEAYRNAMNAGATVENLPETLVQLMHLDALNNAIQVSAAKGKGASTWLTSEQVTQITALPDRSTLQGRRDWIILATVLGAGLRRSEMASLTFDQLHRQPKKNGQLRGILDIVGKGSKKRVIPISPLLEERLKEWHKEVGDGFVARSVSKTGTINGSLSDKAVNDIFHRYGALIGLPELEAHDGRRTWAQLGYNAGIPITQISVLLGHSSVTITQRYLDLSVSLETTVGDFVPLS